MIKPNGSKLKIFMIADDPRIFSGVGTCTNRISRAFIKEGWETVHIAGAVKHPNLEPVIDDIGRKIIPVNGYGDLFLVREIIKREQPDVMWIMTDPRYWVWLWEFEDEIRTKMPLMYYHVWDDNPVPKYNYNYYNSCDSILSISKLTQNIVDTCKRETNATFSSIYCPHGIDLNIYKIIAEDEQFTNVLGEAEWEHGDKKAEKPEPITLKEFKQRIREQCSGWSEDINTIDFIVFWNNRNIRRKQGSMLMEAFNKFVSQGNKKDCALLMHTDISDEHGTDFAAVRDVLFPKAPIVLFPFKIPDDELVRFYNSCACSVNIGSNEGFGLSSAESLACGVPVINNMTGGLQDQMFVDNDETKPCGIPIYPATRILQGSPPTPYIYDDPVNTDDLAAKLQEMYDAYMNRETDPRYYSWKKNARELAEKQFNNELMCQIQVDEVKRLVDEWEPRKRWLIKEL